MRIHVLKHASFEGPVLIAHLLSQRGHQLIETDLYLGRSPENAGPIDALVIMGGAMSANDEEDYPWLAAEKVYVSKAIAQGKPVLGICLGAQIIAAVLGAKVYSNEHKEIGWFPVVSSKQGQLDWGLPAQLCVLHWHAETFDLPDNATRLASSSACANQAFSIGHKVLGLQFHLEMDRAAIALISECCADDLQQGLWVQTAEQLASIPQPELASAQQQLQRLLMRWLASVD